MSGFSVDWLDLREDADRRARDAALLDRALAWLAAGATPSAPALVLDLGAGTGSTLRALTRQTEASPLPLAWRLVDNDEALLAEARRRHGGHHRLETCSGDLADITRLPIEGARLVTASALFDLVSADFLQTLASALAAESRHSPVGVYAALNYDGATCWTPGHPLDEQVLQVFNQDQRRDKSLGPALGPDASQYMKNVFSAAGFEVHSASSPWRLDGSDARLVDALVSGISDAVAQHAVLDPASLEDWTRFRKRHLATGTCVVEHSDVIALPKERP